MKKVLVSVMAMLFLPALSLHFFSAGAADDLFVPSSVGEQMSDFADFLPPVSILSPYQNQIFSNLPRKVGLGWEKLGDAVSYDVELACEKCSAGASWNKSVAKRIEYYTHWVTPALAQDGNYRFRVRGIAQNGWVGPWSSYRYFSVDTKPVVVLPKRAANDVLAIPELITPAKEAVFTNRATSVSWNTVAAAASYELQLACDTCSSGEVKWQGALKQVTTNTSLQLSGLSPHEYRVRVRALDDSGAAGSWSEFRYFSVVK